MLDTRTQELLSRLQGNGPRLAALALAALIAVELARIAITLLGGGPVKSPQPELSTIAPQSTANLVLAGTIATQDPKRGVAIISDGGPSKVYSVGDNVGGASLHSVYLDHVILDRAGALETLLLPRLLGPGMRGAPIVRRQGGADPRTVTAVDNIRRLVQQDP